MTAINSELDIDDKYQQIVGTTLLEDDEEDVSLLITIEVEPGILCDICGQRFTEKSDCNKHINEVHREASNFDTTTNGVDHLKYCCIICDKEYTKISSLQSHFSNVHLPDSNKLIKCSSCNYETLYKYNLTRHVASVHKVMSSTSGLLCEICGMTFSKYSNLNRHRKSVHQVLAIGELSADEASKMKFSCLFCDKEFLRRDSMQIHINSIHLFDRSKIINCSLCNYETTYVSNLKRHVDCRHRRKTPIDESLHKCSVCNAKYNSKRTLRYHERKEHAVGKRKELRRKCPVCEFISDARKTDVIYTHFENVHGFAIKWEHHQFESLEGFNDWKVEVEKSTKTKYRRVSWSRKVTTFQCHRSGTQRTTMGVIQKNLVNKRSCKINSFCPAVIKVQIEESGVKVQHLPVHIGH